MSSQMILNYLDLYGYVIIFMFLFFGIVGIPAPEESLLFLLGVLIAQNQLSFSLAVLAALAGAFVGMLAAYVCGKWVGYPFVKKFGKYIGLTPERWEKARDKFQRNSSKTVFLGFYLPGIRQISPYFAGITGVPFRTFTLFALGGAACWVIPFILLGYFAGSFFSVDPMYVPYIGMMLLLAFIVYVFIKGKKEKRQNL